MRYFYLFIGTIASFSELLNMEPTKRGIKRPISPEQQQAPHSPLIELPKDLKIYITKFLGDSSNLVEALNSIKSLARTSRHFRDLLKNRQNVYTILENLEKKFHRSILEIALIMNTSESKEIAYDLIDKAQNKYADYINTSSSDEKNPYNYANYLLGIANSSDLKNVTSYLYYLHEANSANHTSIIQAIQKSIIDSNFEQFKLWIDSGYFNRFPKEITKAARDSNNIKFFNYLIECGFNIKK